ncbi:hypothetical protein ANOM_010965 [Aspergillus nomiae NRRL 13137]|uniref:C6 zinc finger domain protein n=1 Tax=Aspergillus nomiae NRRL (strain ATCC 15546 / NRRL 13137 / CBS 260.88 / M93) TaxID=1509407 RepID=A0A0L1IN73_ASPN3|nr:uncharacterized protein ANOM_010965 [Aspergillus nomiae NRRL 13137]KNG81061.1 hypothetical protein ANOM_010965 [Aspergillus nomiae NRRL 13137]
MTRVKPGQRQRARAPKVRSGCITCKDPVPLATEPQAPPATLTPCRDPRESRALQFYFEQTLPQISTFFPDELWSVWVPQLAQSEPSIRHALVTLASYHELFTRHEDESTTYLALQYYNKAIKDILYTAKSPRGLFVHFLSSALFICIEILRGRVAHGIVLLKRAIGLLRGIQKRRCGGPTSNSREDSSDLDAVIGLVEAFLFRLSLQAFLLVGDLDDEISSIALSTIKSSKSTLSSHTIFHSPTDARNSLLEIVILCMKRGQEGVLAFSHWRNAFDRFCFTRRYRMTSPADRRTKALLQLYREYLEVEISVAGFQSRDDPSVWDRYYDLFRRMVYCAEQVRDVNNGSVNTQPHFHLDIGTVPILYSIVLKCRDHQVRERALMTLQSQTLLEGLWNSNQLLPVAQRVVVLEGGTSASSPQDISNMIRVRKVLTKFEFHEKLILYYHLSSGWVKESVDIKEDSRYQRSRSSQSMLVGSAAEEQTR